MGQSATIDMSALRFITQRLASAVNKQAGQEEDSSQRFETDVEILAVEGDGVDFHGFVFPTSSSAMTKTSSRLRAGIGGGGRSSG
jgi:hypothetical protein